MKEAGRARRLANHRSNRQFVGSVERAGGWAERLMIGIALSECEDTWFKTTGGILGRRLLVRVILVMFAELRRWSRMVRRVVTAAGLKRE